MYHLLRRLRVGVLAGAPAHARWKVAMADAPEPEDAQAPEGLPEGSEQKPGHRRRRHHKPGIQRMALRRRVVLLLRKRWRPWLAGLAVTALGVFGGRVMPANWVPGAVVIAYCVAVVAVTWTSHRTSVQDRFSRESLLASAIAVLVTTLSLALGYRLMDTIPGMLRSVPADVPYQ
jgi:hypothetical protein